MLNTTEDTIALWQLDGAVLTYETADGEIVRVAFDD